MINLGYHGKDASADLNMVVFVHPPRETYLHTKKMKGVKNFHFQLCTTFSENCS